MTTIFKKFATGTAALALMTTVFATGAMAADSDTNTQKVDIGGGLFSVVIEEQTLGFKNSETQEAISVESPLVLNGKVQNLETSMNFEIVNPQGNGEAWEVSVSATPFATAEGEKQLGSDALTFTNGKITPGEGASIQPILVSENLEPQTITFSANANEGMGTYTVADLAMNLELKPSEVYAGKYTSTVTVQLVTAE